MPITNLLPFELFAREFGDDPDSLSLFNNGAFFRQVRDALADLGFDDTSWHNDANPSISYFPYEGSDCGVRIFIEWQPPVEQEFEPVGLYMTDKRGDPIDRVEVTAFNADLVVAIAKEMRRQVINALDGLEIAYGFDEDENLGEVYLRIPHPTMPGTAHVLQEYLDLTCEEMDEAVALLETLHPNAKLEEF